MKSFLTILFILILLGCEVYYVNRSELSLTGKYVVTKIDITNVDQATEKDSLYQLGSTFISRDLPDPFDSIRINRFYIHLSNTNVRLNLLGTDQFGRDVWEYGNLNEIFYKVWANNAFFSGYLQFTYQTKTGHYQTMTFVIENDGLETLQLKSSGTWLRGEYGQKQVMTLFLTSVGP